jgi:hypothetical protein
MRKNKKIRDDACECFIEDLIQETTDGDDERLCRSQEADLDVYVDPDVGKVSYDFYLKKLTDGLPIIPPTRDRVQKFLDCTDRKPEDVIATIPPHWGKASVEKIAINSVMAGCMPQFMPVVQHAVYAVSQDEFNLSAVNATTHPAAVCIIINGSISRELAINSSSGCLGPGNVANATIGRAVRLSLMNMGGAVPGIGDHATMGSPSKYTFCFAEAENESPWDPLHVERGFKGDVSTVTVMAVDSPQNVNDHRSTHAENLLDTIVHTAAVAGCNNSHVPGELLVIMSPEHAKTVADDGWDKQDVKEYIHENAVVPVELGDRGGRKLDSKWIQDGEVLITRKPEDVMMVVAGGPGRHTMIAHGFGTSSESVTSAIKLKDGTPASSVLDFKN